eukprot:6106848-Pleurochrysis_carterae.AAC.1
MRVLLFSSLASVQHRKRSFRRRSAKIVFRRIAKGRLPTTCQNSCRSGGRLLDAHFELLTKLGPARYEQIWLDLPNLLASFFYYVSLSPPALSLRLVVRVCACWRGWRRPAQLAVRCYAV